MSHDVMDGRLVPNEIVVVLQKIVDELSYSRKEKERQQEEEIRAQHWKEEKLSQLRSQTCIYCDRSNRVMFARGTRIFGCDVCVIDFLTSSLFLPNPSK
jgi:hypothetical protein